jgi:Ca2+-binding RTX toxin-like protein
LAARLVGNDLGNRLRANAAEAAADTLSGGASNDTLYGFGGADSLIGGAGSDHLDGGTGNDTLAGGAGNDRYYVDSLLDRIVESVAGGFDALFSNVWTDLRLAGALQVEGLVYTGVEAATLHGNDLGNNLASRSAADDTLEGGAGNDTLSGGGGADVLRGGTGDDVYLVGDGDLVEEVADEGIDSLRGTATSLAVGALATTVENLYYTGTAAASLVGNGFDNLMSGSTGNDTLTGAAGADSLVGGAGPDRLVGGAGDDRYWVDHLSDRVFETAGGGLLDVVFASSDASLARRANVEALVLQGSAWLAEGSTRNDILVGQAGDNLLLGGAGADTLSGLGADAVSTGSASDVVDGGDGNDVLLAVDFSSAAGARETSLLGGAGNDLYVLGTETGSCSGLDTGGTDTALLLASGSIEALQGVDNVYLLGANASLDARAREAIDRVLAALDPGAVFDGGAGVAANAVGNELANRIVGNALDNALWGRAGNDTLAGGAGRDTLVGESGTDSLVGGLGDDDYFLDAEDSVVELDGEGYDVLNSATITSLDGYAHVEGLLYLGTASVNLHRGVGNTSNDLLAGGSGQDTVAGYAGADTLAGGAGNDSLVGGNDDDVLAGRSRHGHAAWRRRRRRVARRCWRRQPAWRLGRRCAGGRGGRRPAPRRRIGGNRRRGDGRPAVG